MTLYYQLVIVTSVSFFCVLVTVRESDSTFVPGRCICPLTQAGVRGQLKDLTVLPKSPSCNKVTVIVTLTKNSKQVCLSPEAAMGKQLVRCWKRANKLNRDTKVCLKRRRRRRGGQQQRTQQKRQQQ